MNLEKNTAVTWFVAQRVGEENREGLEAICACVCLCMYVHVT